VRPRALQGPRTGRGSRPRPVGPLACCQALKTEALRQAVAELGLEAVLLGIRRDEHGVRAKERTFSPRTADFRWAVGGQPPELWDLYAAVADGGHARVHPLLHFTELDVWEATRAEGVPVNPLDFSRGGWRYRSLGCAPCCVPVASAADSVEAIIGELAAAATPERSGRAQDKEEAFAMQKLRSLGYM
jgi:sulfate adenylyltransferase subunit 2